MPLTIYFPRPRSRRCIPLPARAPITARTAHATARRARTMAMALPPVRVRRPTAPTTILVPSALAPLPRLRNCVPSCASPARRLARRLWNPSWRNSMALHRLRSNATLRGPSVEVAKSIERAGDALARLGGCCSRLALEIPTIACKGRRNGKRFFMELTPRLHVLSRSRLVCIRNTYTRSGRPEDDRCSIRTCSICQYIH